MINTPPIPPQQPETKHGSMREESPKKKHRFFTGNKDAPLSSYPHTRGKRNKKHECTLTCDGEVTVSFPQFPEIEDFTVERVQHVRSLKVIAAGKVKPCAFTPMLSLRNTRMEPPFLDSPPAGRAIPCHVDVYVNEKKHHHLDELEWEEALLDHACAGDAHGVSQALRKMHEDGCVDVKCCAARALWLVASKCRLMVNSGWASTENNRVRGCALLLSAGANRFYTQDPGGKTVFLSAVSYGFHDVARLFLTEHESLGFKPVAVNEEKTQRLKVQKKGEFTALALACRGGHRKLIRLLLDHRGDPSMYEREEDSPLELFNRFLKEKEGEKGLKRKARKENKVNAVDEDDDEDIKNRSGEEGSFFELYNRSASRVEVTIQHRIARKENEANEMNEMMDEDERMDEDIRNRLWEGVLNKQLNIPREMRFVALADEAAHQGKHIVEKEETPVNAKSELVGVRKARLPSFGLPSVPILSEK